MSKRLGNALKRARQAKGLSQLQLANRANVAQSYINDLEAGRKTNPGIQVLHRLAKALGGKVADLLE